MLRKPVCGAVLASLVALLATGCGSDEETEPFTTTGHGTVAVNDRHRHARDRHRQGATDASARLVRREDHHRPARQGVRRLHRLGHLGHGVDPVRGRGRLTGTTGRTANQTMPTKTARPARRSRGSSSSISTRARPASTGASRRSGSSFAAAQGRFAPGVFRDSEVSRGRLRS
jgi:hypothetical protein